MGPMSLRSLVPLLILLVSGCGGEVAPSFQSEPRAPAGQRGGYRSRRPTDRSPNPLSLRPLFGDRLRERSRNQEVVEYGVKSSFRTVFYTKHTRKRPPEMSLRHNGKKLAFRAEGEGPGSVNTWGYDDGRFIVRLPADAPRQADRSHLSARQTARGSQSVPLQPSTQTSCFEVCR